MRDTRVRAILLVLFLSLPGLISFVFPQRLPEPQATASGFRIHRGTNISHWLSQSRRRGAERKLFFQKRDVAFIASSGFDHIRIPIDEEQMFDPEGRPEEEAFLLLESALEWSSEYNLRVIVDLHILRSHHFNEGEKPLWTDPAAQDRFLDCWKILSKRIGHWPASMVAYELMNEPVADDPEDWNQLVARAIGVVRKLEPSRPLVIGSNRWQTVDTFDQLRIPPGDRNIVLSFHFYTPMPLTHYKARWTKVGEYSGPVRYPGLVVADRDMIGLPEDLIEAIGDKRKYNRRELLELLKKPLAMARRTRLPLYCGEWGCLPSAPREDRLRWYTDMRLNLEQSGAAWATWDYKGAFGIVDDEGKPDLELIRILTGALPSP